MNGSLKSLVAAMHNELLPLLRGSRTELLDQAVSWWRQLPFAVVKTSVIPTFNDSPLSLQLSIF